MDISQIEYLRIEEVVAILMYFDNSSDVPLHETLDFNEYGKKLSENAHFILAKDDGVMMGFLAYYLNESGFIYVPQVVVHKDARHKGVGHHMFAELYKLLGDKYNTVLLEVLKSNINARKFYEREGFSFSEDRNDRFLLVR